MQIVKLATILSLFAMVMFTTAVMPATAAYNGYPLRSPLVVQVNCEGHEELHNELIGKNLYGGTDVFVRVHNLTTGLWHTQQVYHLGGPYFKYADGFAYFSERPNSSAILYAGDQTIRFHFAPFGSERVINVTMDC